MVFLRRGEKGLLELSIDWQGTELALHAKDFHLDYLY
jgi:hypothetical protein